MISILLFLSLILANEKPIDEFVDFKDFSQIAKLNITDNDKKLLPNICRSSIFGLPIYKYIPFMNDAYYYDKNKTLSSSFDYESYKSIFFEDEDIDINVIGDLVKKDSPEKLKMIQYNVTNKKAQKNMTILSIKGTSHKKDIFLDLQLYIPSLFLNLLSTFSIFNQDMDSISFKIIEYGLSIPYRLFSHKSFIKEYIDDLEKAYKKVEKYDNVVIVGHSLGGGLSKILARMKKRQAISLSGPGINAFQTQWTEQGNSENFDISFIDLVPDMDLVPRVEVSGGTIFRIICNQGPFKCHNKAISLCETLIMCRNPFSDFYCWKMADIRNNDIRIIKEKSELNKKMNEIK